MTILELPAPPLDTLNDFEHEVQGFRFGLASGPAQSPTIVRVESWSGYGKPDQNVNDVNPPASDGSWFGSDYLGARTFSWTCHLVAPTPEDVMALHDAMAAAWTFPARSDPTAVTTYRSKLPGRPTMLAYGRPRRFTPVFDNLRYGNIDVVCDFLCGDPLLYGDAIVATMGLGAVAGAGLRVPIEVPLVLALPSDGGTTDSVVNVGPAATYPLITFHGPVSGPRLANLTTGEFLWLPSLTIADGQTVIVDTRPIAASVTRGNGGTVHGYLSPGSTMFKLQPGETRMRFSASAYSSDALVTVSARSAWES